MKKSAVGLLALLFLLIVPTSVFADGPVVDIVVVGDEANVDVDVIGTGGVVTVNGQVPFITYSWSDNYNDGWIRNWTDATGEQVDTILENIGILSDGLAKAILFLGDHEGSLEEQQENLASLVAALSDMDKAMVELSGGLDYLRGEMSRITEELSASIATQESVIEDKVRALDSRIDGIYSIGDSLSKSLASLRDALQSFEDKTGVGLSDLGKTLTDLEDSLRSYLSGFAAKQENEIAGLWQDLSDQRNQDRDLLESLSELEHNLGGLKSYLSDFVTSQESEIVALKLSLKNQEQALLGSLGELRCYLDSLAVDQEAKVLKLQQELRDQESELLRLGNDYRSELATMRSDSMNKIGELESLLHTWVWVCVAVASALAGLLLVVVLVLRR